MRTGLAECPWLGDGERVIADKAGCQFRSHLRQDLSEVFRCCFITACSLTLGQDQVDHLLRLTGA